MNNKLSVIISELRKQKGLTQKDLATALHVSDKAVSRWETGNSSPDLDMIFQISKFFNVSFSDLLKARITEVNDNDDVVNEIINEFNEMNKKNAKKIKFVLFITALVILILTITIIFTLSYNKFKVYNVTSDDSSSIYQVKGFYIETNIADKLYLGNIKIKNVSISNDDTVNLTLYYVENDKEYILYDSNGLDNFTYSDQESYIKINNLSDYFDKLYLKATIINSKNKVSEYTTKLNFLLEFSNNKVYQEREVEQIKYKSFDKEEVRNRLISSGFEEVSSSMLIKQDKKLKITYNEDVNKIFYNYEKNKFSYRYTYNIQTGVLEILVFDSNNTEIERYEYDSVHDKVIECQTGSCNDYKEAMKLLEKDILKIMF